MKLIIGGLGQGKLQYALTAYGISPSDVSTELGDSAVINKLQDIIREKLIDGGDPVADILSHAQAHPDVIYISDEVGSGVIPIAPFERNWREAVGRCLVLLASRAEKVERVFCGLPVVLKP